MSLSDTNACKMVCPGLRSFEGPGQAGKVVYAMTLAVGVERIAFFSVSAVVHPCRVDGRPVCIVGSIG